MGSIGFPEIMVVLVVALIVLGPARLPDAARSMGKALRELRSLTAGFEREVRAALDDDSPPPPAEAGHGIDPGALAPGMSYGQTPRSEDGGAPGDRQGSAGLIAPVEPDDR